MSSNKSREELMAEESEEKLVAAISKVAHALGRIADGIKVIADDRKKRTKWELER